MTNTSSNSCLEYLLSPSSISSLVESWLKEDIPSFDYGGIVVGEKEETAVLLCKSPGVLAGVPFFNAVFKAVDCEVHWQTKEGAFLEPIFLAAIVKGKARNILMGERSALNCIARASGVATLARNLRNLADKSDWKGRVAGTRKTTPGFRMVEKYALLVGGADTHRYDLSSMIMLKDNHIWSAGSITQAVKNARKAGGFSIKIEVECRSLEEAREAASAGAEIIMLDNFAPEAAASAARQLKTEFPHLLLEASGGITEESLPTFCIPDIDVISTSRLTQGYPVVDFSLKIRKEGHDPRNPLVQS
ncbi:nicotinate-nucleotide pyrophosphorylase [carboxylating]-like [Lytechinus variegatus]|uniref:nicotinate-nucleotide pyrophosphorylase [carboxylating]-like n=1 Tax=Lytechinus variegatus TaxID=7654 RepID=UPI001BB147FC|nr:nicotinate-nucleotide pyrophosphorylase [carboxylating]-like [Lytechinus variegatus]